MNLYDIFAWFTGAYSVVVIFLVVFSVVKKSNSNYYSNVASIESVYLENDIQTWRNYFQKGIKISAQAMGRIAFSLVLGAYFLVHIQVNQGKNYNDTKQLKSYQTSVTKSTLSCINSIKGWY